MFYYYGRKALIAALYPIPEHKTIIEPFAGAACYSLLHWKKEVILIDAYEPVIRLWKFLQQMTPKDILALPKLFWGLDIRKLGLSEGERLLLGFYAGLSAFSPLNIVSEWAGLRFKRKPNPWQRLAAEIHKIKHWQIMPAGDYTSAPDIKATWFVDPPYQVGGHKYVKSNSEIDYIQLGNWCRSRQGQLIVCEREGADWLPFEHLATTRHSNINKTRREMIYTNSLLPEELFNYRRENGKANSKRGRESKRVLQESTGKRVS